ncbi:hypothetical protein WMF26_00645 [Sorangium sp. So ce185]|uniref:DUF11 domain-containing protein n=1 Tax=Sorangium sp. So ce185 TaxID=3133287 RepID=UPI003F607E46
MKRRYVIGGLVGLAVVAGQGGAAHADPERLLEVSQRGDFLLIGNTLGYECGSDVTLPAPVVGTVPEECGGSGNTDTSPDIFWRSDSPTAGAAEANRGIAADQARSTAWLQVPAGASVTHAFLYWGAHTAANAGADTTVTLDRPGAGGFSAEIVAAAPSGGSFTASSEPGVPAAPHAYYQSYSDITALVQANGTGAYRVSGVSTKAFGDNDNNNFAGWWMVVFYELASEPPRHLALFHGLDAVNTGNSREATLDGFLVPAAGYDAKIGLVAFEGDLAHTGDQFFFNGGAALSNAQNPVSNFFNGTRSSLGGLVSVDGDLPQLTGAAGTMSGMDIDVLDITPKVSPGQTSAPIVASSNGDLYFLAGFITSISTFKPEFTSSTKAARDVNGGSLLPGDTIEYTIVIRNTGNDASVNTVMTDPLPAGVSYVPGSLAIAAGPNMGAKTDAAGDDQGEYDATSRTVTVRVGDGATGATGGTIAVNGTTTVTFRVTVDAGATGLIENQAIINAAGQQGAPNEETPTDGDDETGGPQPTDVVIDECETDAQCEGDTPHCDTAATPNACVECTTDAQCGPLTPQCDLDGNVCVCEPTGAEICTDAIDNDCDGVINNGCDADDDGIDDLVEVDGGTDPNDADSDDDGVPDGQEPRWNEDTDGDGLINALDPDSDNDGLFDGTELGLPCDNPATNAAAGHCRADGDEGATKTDPLDADSDDGGVSDGNEDVDLDGVIDEGETDPNSGEDDATPPVDSDGDGLSDALEETIGTDPNDADSDDDGVIDGDEPNFSDDTDGDGLINALDVDSDNDGLFDGTELGLGCDNPATNTEAGHCIADADEGATKTSPLDADTDDGGVTDGNEDIDRNGVIDADETDPNDGGDDLPMVDTDGDGLIDALETEIGTDPNDADSDDDGVIDGDEPNFRDDHDGDGLINALDPDSDDDGLFDGTELGLPCGLEATDPEAESCIADADPETKTHPLDRDTDDGGVPDGVEDANHNGAIDEGETDPNNGDDDPVADDRDGDGLPDAVEEMIGSDPDDADSDDDGVPDGQEPRPGEDTDGDGLINVLDVDSDNDGLFDGTELGLGCDHEGTNADAGHCRPDADNGATKTDPLDADTDDGGVPDGQEDVNLNGAIDEGETDPNNGDDDGMPADTDGDGLSDAVEEEIGTDPNDADSDDDGVLDGDEPNFSDDHDGDGLINALDPDSDGDGLFDGTELGHDCADAATDPEAGTCIPDADPTTTTNPLDADTDDGGVKDGDEDANHNGAIDAGETDPNDGDDDQTDACRQDSDCGGPTSGSICVDHACVDGCRGADGNSCPSGEVCSSTDSAPGTCGPAEANDPTGIFAEGNGLCTARPGPAGNARSAGALLPMLAALAGLALRRRRTGR